VTAYAYLFRGDPVAYVERMDDLPQALLEVHPTLAAAVPRVFEKLYANIIQKGQENTGVKRRLFEIANAIDFESYPVAAFRHMLRGLGVGGIGIVEQRGGKQGTNLHGGEDDGQKNPCGRSGQPLLRTGFYVQGICPSEGSCKVQDSSCAGSSWRGLEMRAGSRKRLVICLTCGHRLGLRC
jgi:hypothetical protein